MMPPDEFEAGIAEFEDLVGLAGAPNFEDEREEI